MASIWTPKSEHQTIRKWRSQYSTDPKSECKVFRQLTNLFFMFSFLWSHSAQCTHIVRNKRFGNEIVKSLKSFVIICILYAMITDFLILILIRFVIWRVFLLWFLFLHPFNRSVGAWRKFYDKIDLFQTILKYGSETIWKSLIISISILLT